MEAFEAKRSQARAGACTAALSSLWGYVRARMGNALGLARSNQAATQPCSHEPTHPAPAMQEHADEEDAIYMEWMKQAEERAREARRVIQEKKDLELLEGRCEGTHAHACAHACFQGGSLSRPLACGAKGNVL